VKNILGFNTKKIVNSKGITNQKIIKMVKDLNHKG